ncbi:Gldg family protein [Pseudenhygromyxa sp. WMMC2535]|uniref:Gldg family protein n=1 Tax=Pseudenhygromyxa sp. WMMC2535 TaxID=2712867 RepID=UPI0020D042CE|nr:Gldg family protein [Pseudenhygromyxa sp. WMMC2535]
MIRRVVAWLRGTAAVCRRELLSLFVTPLAYLVGTLFLLNQGWNFSLLLQVLNDPLAARGPVMQFYFGGSFFIFWLPVVFICSAISMRLVAEERRQGTLEALLTAPLEPSQVIIGKYLGALAFYAALWLPTGSFYLLLRGAAGPTMAPDIGPILSGYLGAMLCGASFLAVGLVFSAFARNQLAAAIGTFVSCTIVLLAGLLTDQVELWLSKIIGRTSLLAMMQELAQGIVDGHWIWLHLAVVVAAIALAIVAVNPRRDWQSFTQAALTCVAAGHLAVFAGNHSERGDWTRDQVYTLSERAKDVLVQLQGPIDVIVLAPATIGGGRQNPVRGELREVLARMAAVSPALRVTLVDPDVERQEAERLVDDFGLSGRELPDGVVLIRAGQGTELRRAHLLPGDLVTYATGPEVQANGPRVKSFRGEEALLGKFLEVSDPRKVTVCYTQGHGEPAFDDLQPFNGYAHLRDLLRDANLDTRVADLDGERGLDGCDLLLVAGPQGALPQTHVEAVRRYAEQGGDLLILAGAVFARGKPALVTHGLEPLCAELGIHFGDRVVVDTTPVPGASDLLSFTLQDGWADHPAVRSLAFEPVAFFNARELRVDRDAEVLLATSARGWAEAGIEDLQQGGLVSYDEALDHRGPIPVIAAAERAATNTRVVVVGSDELALNAWLREDVGYSRGRDLILNLIGWLTQREVLLGIRPRDREHVKLVLLPEQLRRMTWMCLFGLPGFAIGVGLLVLWRRRK